MKASLRTAVSLATEARSMARYRFEEAFYVNDVFDYVGTAKAPRPHHLKVTEPFDDLVKLLPEYPELRNLRYPTRKPEDVMLSLAATCAKGQSGGFVEYLPGEEEFVIRQMMYDEDGPEPPSFLVDCRLPTPREVLAVVARLSDESNAGYPYCLTGAPKREVALANFSATYRSVCERILLLTETDDVPLDPRELVQKNFCDPVFAVEKDEPYDHTRKTCRTIIMGSTIDEIIDRLYTDSHDEFEIDNFCRFRSANGIGFTPEHKQALGEAVADMVMDAREAFDGLDPANPLAKSDISGFDTNEFEEEAETEAEVLLRRYGVPPARRRSGEWRSEDPAEEQPWHRYARRLVLNRTRATFRSIFVFGDGTLWSQKTRGIQKSGTKRTSSRNTNVRSIRHLRCAFRFHVGLDLDIGPSPTNNHILVALVHNPCYEVTGCDWYTKNHPSLGVGDDMVEPNYPGLVQNYRNINTRIKEGSFAACSPDNFEFCSHVWAKGAKHPKPLNAAKAAFRLLCAEPSPQKYVQWAFAYWHADDRERYIHLFRQLGYPAGKNKLPTVQKRV